MITQIRAAIAKETRLLVRDVHGLALLFLLPLAFILIMSLALQDAFASRNGKQIEVALLDRDATVDSRELTKRLDDHDAFAITQPDTDAQTADLIALVDQQGAMFGVAIPQGYSDTILDDAEDADAVEVIVSPDADKRTEMIFISALRESLGRHKVDAMLAAMAEAGGEEPDTDSKALDTPVEVSYSYAATVDAPPSAVQQNVPAWLVFAIFFVAIPFSNTFISERNLGVQRRLTTTGMGPASQFIGKLVPYFIVNLMQVGLMLVAGAWLVPCLGGDALQIQGSPIALFVLACCISIAALSLALVISVMAGTTEQATLASGIGNVVLAALGGVMVPRFIMPQAMQKLSDISPMAWGLDGFLELLLHDGGLGDIVNHIVKLCVFSLIMVSIAGFMQGRKLSV